MQHLKRWLSAWSFLSLDLVRPVFTDLWFPNQEDRFQHRLRQTLDVAQRQYPNDPPIRHHLLAKWYLDDFGSESLGLAERWVTTLFYSGGSDRASEFLWRALVLSEMNIPQALRDRFLSLRESLRRGHARIDGQLSTSRAVVLSEWDLGHLTSPGQEQSYEHDLLSNMLVYNDFVLGWHRHCSDMPMELMVELFRAGVKYAEAHQMPSHQLAFPGIWDIEHAWIVDRVCGLSEPS